MIYITEISSLYRSHGLGCIEFIVNINKYLQTKRKVPNHLIIGDFNINILENNNISFEFLNNLLGKGFIPTFTKTTRPTTLASEAGTCIDNIFIKTNFLIAKSLTLKIPITDYYPIFLEIKNEKIINKTETDEPRYGYNYNAIFKIH